MEVAVEPDIELIQSKAGWMRGLQCLRRIWPRTLDFALGRNPTMYAVDRAWPFVVRDGFDTWRRSMAGLPIVNEVIR